MVIDLQQVINSSLSLQLVSVLAQTLPPQLGYWIADYAAEQVARRRNSKIVRAVRANQWVISGGALRGEELDRAVHATLHHSAHCLFDLYHYVHQLAAARQLIILDSFFQRLVGRPEFDDRGLVIVGLHLSNFDLVLQCLCRQGMKPLVLTIPNPHGGRRLEYEMRRKSGINLIPGSVGALRQALKHLQLGGLVLTGIDRPIPQPRVYPHFFGRPAALPMHHIFLATKARVPIVIASAYLGQDGKYYIATSDLIEMDCHPDQELETLQNAEKVLAVAEQFIQRAPRQWCVPLPVWPEILDLVPQ